MSERLVYHTQTAPPVPSVHVQRADPAKENQMVARVDRRGYVVSASSTREKPEGLGFLSFVWASRDRYPLDAEDVVVPPGFTLDATSGRCVRVVEVEGEMKARITTEVVPLMADGGLPSPRQEKSDNPTQEIK